MSDESATRHGRCIYCGTSRATTKPVCPECGRTWIDTKVDEDLPALTPELVAAAVEERQAAETIDLPPPPDEGQRRPWGILIGALLGLIIIVALFAGAFSGDDGDPVATPTTADPTTTATSTTAAPTTGEPTTTAPATTTTSTTTTTTTTTTLAPIEAEGTPVPIEELKLGAFALGPLSFDSGTSYLGRLVASLGQPDSRTEIGTDFGLCDGETGYAYTWGWLTAIFRNDDGTEVLVGGRLDLSDDDHPTQAITSLSGLAVGDTLDRIGDIYLQSGLAFVDIDGVSNFVLLRSVTNATLLWGPVTATADTGIIEGMYSPRSCDRGPVASP